MIGKTPTTAPTPLKIVASRPVILHNLTFVFQEGIAKVHLDQPFSSSFIIYNLSLAFGFNAKNMSPAHEMSKKEVCLQAFGFLLRFIKDISFIGFLNHTQSCSGPLLALNSGIFLNGTQGIICGARD